MTLMHISMRTIGKLLPIFLLGVVFSAHGQLTSLSQEELGMAEVLAKLRAHAESGDANAQYDLAWMYDTGDNNKILARDSRKAAEWYEKAAIQGHAKAQAGLGLAYVNGRGVTKNDILGVEWLQKASEQGDADAQLELGWLYQDKRGMPSDPTKLLRWREHAADRGFAHAQFSLGLMYYRGDGVKKDIARAVEMWQKAVIQGYPDAQFNLGSMYYFGDGVQKNLSKAIELWERAAASANTNAQYNLALAYYLGVGVSKNELLSYVWSNLAVEYGNNEHAKKLRDSITISSAQRESANKMFLNWQIGKVYRADPAN